MGFLGAYLIHFCVVFWGKTLLSLAWFVFWYITLMDIYNNDEGGFFFFFEFQLGFQIPEFIEEERKDNNEECDLIKYSLGMLIFVKLVS